MVYLPIGTTQAVISCVGLTYRQSKALLSVAPYFCTNFTKGGNSTFMERTNSLSEDKTDRQAVNAALAERVQAGDNAALGELWQANRALLGQYFLQWHLSHRKIAASHGITLEDMEQDGYFATLYAAKSYDPAAGAFSTWLMIYAKRQIMMTLSNGRRRYVKGKDGRRHTLAADPLNNCTSLDLLLDESNDSGATLGDQQPDPSAEIPFRQAEDAIFTSELHAAIEEAFQKLTEKEVYAIRATFFEGCTLKAAAEITGISWQRVQQNQRSGLNKMRRNPAILRFRDEVIQSHAWNGTGFTSWYERGSVEERTVEWLEEKGFYGESEGT